MRKRTKQAVLIVIGLVAIPAVLFGLLVLGRLGTAFVGLLRSPVRVEATDAGPPADAQPPGELALAQTDAEGRRPNRLVHEKSPYLLQHAYNPVEWYPWGNEAFAKAKREDKPVFLSVGYSTCYWCHVMEQESFDNPDVAKLMNETVVAIKVDREERPDIDAIYMNAVQAMTGSGGWPMSVFLTPDGQPFWGGTYFPAEDRWGRPGFKTVLRSISDAWKTKRQDILRSSKQLTQAIQAGASTGSSAQLSADMLQNARTQFALQYDGVHGGFGPAPKFPRSHSLSFLLRSWHRDGQPKALEMVETTLDGMARGGMHDHLGGGFHRYSTDQKWLVPHFEKMLYDQALLARTYLEAYQVTGKSQYAEVARDVFEYVLRDMRDATGAFHSAEDAGEVGKEGEYYVWTPQEIDAVLSAEEAALAKRFYGVTPGGNFSATEHGGSANQFGGEHGTTILSVATPLDAFAVNEQRPVEEVRRQLDAARATLLAVRSQRERPHRDDKILTDWNGLLIGSLAYGARALDEPRYAQAAQEAATFILDRLQRNGRLLHRYRDGEASIPAFLDDYAFLAWGLTDLYEATGEARWLAEAKRLTKEMVRLFWDDKAGGFFFSGDQNERLIAQTKELYDGALPSGNSVAALNLVRLGILTMDKELQGYAERQVQTFSGQVSQAPHAFPQLLIALDFWLGPSQEIVIAGDPVSGDTQEMLRAVYRRFLPRAVLAVHPVGEAAQTVEALVPFIKEQRPLQGKATAYICKNYVCNLPTTDVAKMVDLLNDATQ
ncbi:MAG: thioredoxin domain-containing protein [Candidatus Omnitrophica bacterium]|nr:thioredoxin domain-containing protein [Candidatus Omnitrophota bacterium]